VELAAAAKTAAVENSCLTADKNSVRNDATSITNCEGRDANETTGLQGAIKKKINVEIN